MYTELPAGSFQGLGAFYTERASMATRRAAMRGLGDVNFCTDPGWQFANRLVGAAGSIYGQAAGSDAGHRTAARSISAAGDAWAQTCAAQAGATATGAAQPTETPADVYARARADTLAQAEAQRRAQLSLQAQQQSQTNTYLIVGGIAVVAVGIAAVLALR